MEAIINKIRNVLDIPAQERNFSFEPKTISYNAPLDIEKQLYHGFYFDLRRKIGGDYYLLNISLCILNKPICTIANNLQIEAINKRENLSIALKKSLIKDIKKNQTLISLSNWSEIDIIFKEKISIWRCSIFSLEDLNDYEWQLLTLFEKGIKWAEHAKDWEFIINWAFNHDNALQGLSILKYLDKKEEFKRRKEESLVEYEKKKYSTKEIEMISI